MVIKLQTTRIQFDHMYATAHKKGAKNITVPRGAIINLLIDHGAMCDALKVKEPTPQEGSDLV